MPNENGQYEDKIKHFRELRESKYRSRTGWLTFVERVVLEPGENRVAIGRFHLSADGVQFEPELGVQVERNGEPVRESIDIAVGEDKTRPDQLVGAGKTYEVVRRGDRVNVRVRDPEARALRDFRGIDAFPIDLAYRVIATLTRFDPPR